jgi:hypothetical protein
MAQRLFWALNWLRILVYPNEVHLAKHSCDCHCVLQMHKPLSSQHSLGGLSHLRLLMAFSPKHENAQSKYIGGESERTCITSTLWQFYPLRDLQSVSESPTPGSKQAR